MIEKQAKTIPVSMIEYLPIFLLFLDMWFYK